MNDIDPLNLESRRKIYKVIKNYPGIHLSQIFKKTSLSHSSIRYHVKYLESHNIITSKKEKGYTRFYPSKGFSTTHKDVINFLRIETTRNILLLLIVSPCCSQNTLSIELEKHPTTIKYFLKKLLEKNIIEKADVKNNIATTNLKKLKYMQYHKKGREIVYRFKDPYLVHNAFIIYQDGLLDEGFSKKIIDYCKQVGKIHNSGDIVPSYSVSYNNVINCFYEMFPNPYHV